MKKRHKLVFDIVTSAINTAAAVVAAIGIFVAVGDGINIKITTNVNVLGTAILEDNNTQNIKSFIDAFESKESKKSLQDQ